MTQLGTSDAVPRHSLKAKVINGVFWVGATKGLAQIITWAITIFVVRILSPADYGLMGMAVLFTGFLLLFNDFGLGAAIVQNPEVRDDQISDFRWVVFLISAALFGLLCAGAPLVAVYFNEPRLVNIVRVLGISFLLSGIGTPAMYMLSRRMEFKERSQAEFVGSLVGGVSTLVFALLRLGVWSLIFGYLLQQFATQGLYCYFSPLPLRARFSVRNISAFMKFGFQIAAARLLWFVSSNADFMVVGRVLGTVQLGYYSLAFQFSSMPIDKIVNLVNQVAFPSFAAVQNDNETLRRHFSRVISTVALLTFPIFIGLALAADSAVALFLTAKWTPAVLPLKILCVVSCIRALHATNAPLVVAKGGTRVVLFNNFLQALCMPLAFFIGARAGLFGVSIAWLITAPVLFLVLTRQTLRMISLPATAYLGSLKHAIAGTLLMTAVVRLVQVRLLASAPLPYVVGITCALGFIVYAAYQVVFNTEVVREPVAMACGKLPVRWRSSSSRHLARGIVLIERAKSWNSRARF